ncbi:hypothetical protein [Lignipirellula cremea]|uniref:Serine/threonine specific protein phosphatases domain-containing protein n=1 Tax=Lignipirellula cremea TaxID=2528010 RepID=A0A518DVV0_9BACT|nr:hypothetical protein [Lignipirellula cremea]QDU95959.1 hypothetical protein Pla8534_37780 [Lignipirellula cremea]
MAWAAQIDLLEDLFGLTDNRGNHEGYPVSEFHLYAGDEETDEPDALIDSLHECLNYLDD